jgi:hypothetical protein
MAKTPLEIKSLARAHTATAIKTLHGIMTRSTSDQAKVAAAKELLDRGWGKAEFKGELEHTVRNVVRVPEKALDSEEWQQQHAQQMTFQ